MLILGLLLLFTVAAYKYWQAVTSRRPKRYPPGPPNSLPFLGNLVQLGRKPHLKIQEWKAIYGPIFSCKFASMNMVVVSDAKLGRELFQHEATTGRIPGEMWDNVSSRTGINTAEGQSWIEQRNFTIKAFKTLFSVGCLEGLILEQAKALVSYFEKHCDSGPVHMYDVFTGNLLNIIWNLLAGEIRDSGDLDDLQPIKVVEEFLEAMNHGLQSGLIFAPWLRHIIPERSGYNRIMKAGEALHKVTDAVVKKHLEAKKSKDRSTRDFLGQYLDHMAEVKNPESSFFEEKGRQNLRGIVGDMFNAATETTTSTLEHTFLYLAHHPEVQKEMQKELDAVVGSRIPYMTDNLPYCEAVVNEVLRRSTVTPIGFPHRATKAFEFHGYHFPENTTFIVDIHGSHFNPQIWGDPHNFRPARWLSEDGSRVLKSDALIPFSVGRRFCIGDTMGLVVVRLIMVSIIQKFSVGVCEGTLEMDDVTPGVVLRPRPYKLSFKLRK